MLASRSVFAAEEGGGGCRGDVGGGGGCGFVSGKTEKREMCEVYGCSWGNGKCSSLDL